MTHTPGWVISQIRAYFLGVWCSATYSDSSGFLPCSSMTVTVLTSKCPVSTDSGRVTLFYWCVLFISMGPTRSSPNCSWVTNSALYQWQGWFMIYTGANN